LTVTLVGSSWVQRFPLVVSWVGLGQSADGLGWIGPQNRPMDNSENKVISFGA